MDAISLLKYFGPGILLMMTGVGTSHLITVPVVGGRFGWALLWAIPAAYIFKWYGFRMAYRFTYATGLSILDAMATTKKKWMLWYLMFVHIVQIFIGQAGRLIACAAVLYYGFTVPGYLALDLWAYAIIIGGISLALLLSGKYEVLELVVKALLLIVTISFIIVYAVNPPNPGVYTEVFNIRLPPEAWLVLAAGIGLLPTGIDSTLQASEWGLAKSRGLPRFREQLEEEGATNEFDPHDDPTIEDVRIDYDRLSEDSREYAYRWFRIGLRDFDFGNAVSLGLAIIIMSLSVIWMYPADVEGREAIGQIASIFTESVGAWMMIIFIIGAFGITFSTQLNYFDGWPRVIGSISRNLFEPVYENRGIGDPDAETRKKWYAEYNLWRIFMVASFAGSVAIIAGIPEPVFLVLVASALSGIIAPVIFFFNFWYCLKAIPEDSEFYPARWEIAFTWVSLAVFTILMVASVLAVLGFLEPVLEALNLR